MNLGTGFKRIRKDRKISQKRIAEMIGISVTAMVQIEHGASIPKISTINKFCSELGITKSYLYINCINIEDVHESQRQYFNPLMEILLNMLK
jgi:transcriptional regulator with XRE-family HTH domain